MSAYKTHPSSPLRLQPPRHTHHAGSSRSFILLAPTATRNKKKPIPQTKKKTFPILPSLSSSPPCHRRRRRSLQRQQLQAQALQTKLLQIAYLCFFGWRETTA